MDGPKIVGRFDDLRYEISREMTEVIFVFIQHPRQSGGGQIAMTSHTRKPAVRPVHDSRQHLLEGAELVGDSRLEIQTELHLGNCRHEVFPVLSDEEQKKSGSLIAIEDIRTEIQARDLLPSDMLNSRPVLSLESDFFPKPPADGLLGDSRPLHEFGNAACKSLLASSDVNGALKSSNVIYIHEHKHTTKVVSVNNSSRVPNHKRSCTVLPMAPRTKQVMRAPKEADTKVRQAAKGPDGLTLGQRIDIAMEARSRALGRKYTYTELRRDASIAAGRSGGEEDEVISQQNLSLVVNNKNSESGATPALAAALMVPAMWLGYGVGPSSIIDELMREANSVKRDARK